LEIIETAANSGSTAVDIYMQFNGDTGAHYTRQFLNASGSSVTAGQNASTAQAAIANVPGTGAPSGNADTAIITIPLYAGTTFLKNAYSTHMDVAGSSVGALAAAVSGFQWSSNAAITSIVLGGLSGNFVAGSTFQVYGIN
jgi:hypothetical protein